LAFDVEGNEHKLIRLNALWSAIKTSNESGEPLANASSFFRDDYRTRAGTGFDENSLRLADVYDEIDNLRAIRDRDLVGAGPNEQDSIIAQYDRAMGQLFHENRRWMPKKGNEPIRYSPTEDREGKYGWQEGMSREGFLKSQTGAYTLSEDQSRWLAKRLGIRQDAGHTVPLGGIVISDDERREFFIDTSELEELPNNEWLLRGTNAITNLAIEDAKGNRSKHNKIGRQLRDIIEANVAFTKTRSLLEYNLGGDTSFRKLSDFSTQIQTLFAHGDRDINELQAIGEDLILQTGVQEAPTLPKRKGDNQNDLVPAFQKNSSTQNQGPLVEYTQRGNQVFNPRVDGTPLGPGGGSLISNLLSIQGRFNLPNLLSIGPNTPKHMKTGAKFVSPLIPGGDQVIAADEVLTETFSSNPNTSRGYAKLAKQPLNVIGATYLNKPDLGNQVQNVTGVVQGIKDKNVAEVISSGAGLFSQQSIEKINNEDDDLLLTGS